MLGVLTMFTARLGSFYPANHSPSEIETNKNRENLQVPAGVVLCLEPMRVLEQVHQNAVVMWATPSENGSLPQGGHGLTNTQIQNRLKRVFKALYYDAQPKIMAEIIAKNGKATKY